MSIYQKNPCYTCNKRTTLCHSDCCEYHMWKQDVEVYREDERNKKSVEHSAYMRDKRRREV